MVPDRLDRGPVATIGAWSCLAVFPPGAEYVLPIFGVLVPVLSAAIMWLPGALVIHAVGFGLHRLLSPDRRRWREWRPRSVVVVHVLWMLVMAGMAVALIIDSFWGASATGSQ